MVGTSMSCIVFQHNYHYCIICIIIFIGDVDLGKAEPEKHGQQGAVRVVIIIRSDLA